MLNVFASAFRTPDLRKKLLFSLLIIGVFRLGSVIPTPGVSYTAINTCIAQINASGEGLGNTIYGMINLFSGGALLQLSIFSLGIMPYITASIILQLLGVVIPRLEALKKEGQAGTARITQYTRYLTIGLAILQSTTVITMARTPGRLFQGCAEQLVPNQSITLLLTMVFVMTAGTSLIMWLGELITDRGVGNGMSILIFTSIIATFPGQIASIWKIDGSLKFVLTFVVGTFIIAAVVFVEQAQRRIPIQYAKRQVGRRQYGGTSTYLPIKVNQAGVIPVIFASSLLYLPILVVQLSGSNSSWAQIISTYLNSQRWPYLVFNAALIIFFTYFYVSITFNPEELADDFKKYGGFVPGIRAGKPTADYLRYVINRLTAPGSLYLAMIATIPYVAFDLLGVGKRFIFGGTSLLIMVGVGLDTVKQIESQLHQRNYEGFLR